MKSRSVTVSDVAAALEARAPSGTAEDWDNVGLLVGDPGARTAGAVVAIDLSEKTIRTAEARGYKLIVNHHPCIFPRGRGPSRLAAGNLVYEAARRGISVIACHTNFDQCALEVVKTISHGLGVTPRGRLHENSSGQLGKLVVFVPSTHVEKVREAICLAGAGQVGDYDSCTFGAAGTGTFRGGENTRPFLGKPGTRETASEIRLESIFPKGLTKDIVAAMRRAHPYEEIAYDIYALEQPMGSKGLVRGLGYGFWGEYSRPRPFPEVLKNVRSLFNIDGFWLTNPAPSRIKRLAFTPGKGASFVDAASSLGIELLITGEAGYHPALGGARRGLTVIELGHRQSERFFLTTMEGWLSELGLKTVVEKEPTQRWVSGGKK